MRWWRRLLGAGLTAALLHAQTPETFHTGTRLVEVEVIVRDKTGPVKGLTKEDFALLDQGKPQQIALFRSGPSSVRESPAAIPQGAISNRTDSQGRPINGATAVLLDQLNTRIDYKAYERGKVAQLLRSLASTDRIALYALGKDLHILQDFTDDPDKLIAAVSKLDQGLDLLPNFMGDDKGGVMLDFPDPSKIRTGNPLADAVMRKAIADTSAAELQNNALIYNDITVEALSRIIQHLSGLPGRKNLVWLKELPIVPPQVMAMAVQANVSVYPVLIRTVEYANDIFGLQHAARDLAKATGGEGFSDAGDLTLALHTAEEDSLNAYTLGYYPSEDMLDGRFHRISVKLRDAALQVRYRPGYLATRVPPPSPVPTTQELLEDPLDSTAVGLVAQLQPDPAHPAMRQLRVNVDLRDILLTSKNGRADGAFDVLLEDGKTVSHWFPVQIDLPEDKLASVLESGYRVAIGNIDVQQGLRIFVRDHTTGATGSLHVAASEN